MDRRKLLALALGGAGAAATIGIVGVSQAMTTDASPVDRTATEPAYGAGLFDVDPPQKDLSDDPNVMITGDLAALPEDMEF